MIIPLQRIRMNKIFCGIVLWSFLCFSCGRPKPMSLSDVSADSACAVAEYDLADIENAGELIAVTLSGPETYYQFHGRDLGLQYLLAERFANSLGLRLRMETARDTAELVSMLKQSKVDLIAFPLSRALVKRQHLTVCGLTTAGGQTGWAVRSQSRELAEALDKWYRPDMALSVTKEQKQLLQKPLVHRRVHAVYQNRGKGIVSSYDHLFVQAAATIGWDWRLLAAQCYQESAFDPEAVSWAGARGLMQIMPKTADYLGVAVNDLYRPETNINAAAKYIRQLEHQFGDIRNPLERKKFVLAAYNGGYHHIRDAQRLAQKNRRNTQTWDAVSWYVLNLCKPQYYRDPVVRYGYMIGSETYHYVYDILDRWADYQGVAHAPRSVVSDELHFDPQKMHGTNRFTRQNNGVTPRNDSIFQMR